MKARDCIPRLFYPMNKFQKSLERFFGEYSKWIFIIPSLILLAFFALPLLAIVLRSANLNFFDNAFSQQAFKALKLSLVTSSIATICAAVFGTPLAYMLARWKFRYK